MKLSVTIRGDVDQLRRSYLERRSAIDLELEGVIESYLRRQYEVDVQVEVEEVGRR